MSAWVSQNLLARLLQDLQALRKSLVQLLVSSMKTIYAIFDKDGHLMHAEEDAFNATQHILDAVDMNIEGAEKWVARLYSQSTEDVAAGEKDKNIEFHEKELWDANPDCKHDIKGKWNGGVECTKCGGWFCY